MLLEEVSVDLVDEAGGHFSKLEHDIIKMRLDANGALLSAVQQRSLKDTSHSKYNPKCGSCFAASSLVPKGHCCNTCDDILTLYAKAGISKDIALRAPQCNEDDPNMPMAGEVGCRIEGRLSVKKLDGNMHICAGDSVSQAGGHMHMINWATLRNFNVSHHIHQLSFGDYFKVILYFFFAQRNGSSFIFDPFLC